MWFENYYEDTEVLHVNTENYRCWYTPLDREEREAKLDLNGQWQFAYFENPEMVPDITKGNYVPIDTIPVPSSWQLHGYGVPSYINTRYPFPYDPPYVPLQNPCGLYRRTWNLTGQEAEADLYLNFDGVDSCFYVWVNGIFVGYSQVSHAVSEFSIGNVVREGENTIYVLVLTWCDGSYLEDQDKFRLSGIFRDVYILKRPKQYIWNYRISTDVRGNSAEVLVAADFVGTPSVMCSFYDMNGVLIERTRMKGGKCSFTVSQPQLWNAEEPYLYELVLEGEEVIREKVGIRTVDISEGIFRINEKPVKLKGVNRHDSSPYRGAAVTREDVKQDLLLMKHSNINAIRTSHYPNSPWFAQMCDRYGFYLMEEADIETQGCGETYCTEDRDSVALLTVEPAFKQAMLDRVQSMVIRDINRPCVIFWSLGNESGFGENLEEAGRWVKVYDPGRPLHYENGTWFQKRKVDISMLDVVSRMYAPVEWIEEYCSGENNKKPFIHCEYSHAMGNGPGDLEDYYEQMIRHEKHAGGFVWEWCDHGIHCGEDEKGREKFLYGGDFDEELHDGAYCLDGLVYPDRRPHTGLYELKNVLRPLRVVSWKEGGEVLLKNMLDFTDAKDFIRIGYEWKSEGVLLLAGEFPTYSILPGAVKNIQVPLPEQNTGDLTLKLIYREIEPETGETAGRELGFDQIILHRTLKEESPAEDLDVSIRKEGEEYRIEGENFCYMYSGRSGTFSALERDNVSFCDKPARWTVFRAPADNDRSVMEMWEEAGYDRASVRVYRTDYELKGNCAVLTSQISLAARSLQPFLRMTVRWTVDGKGVIFCSVQAEFDLEFPWLPRFGLQMYLSEQFQEICYYGNGPYENYPDKHQASWLDVFRTDVGALHEDYICPQENGSHGGCSWSEILCEKGLLRVSAPRPFSFQATYYEAEELYRRKHNFDLEKSGSIIYTIDYMQSGMGSASCGPELAVKYRLYQEKIEWNFTIEPREGL